VSIYARARVCVYVCGYVPQNVHVDARVRTIAEIARVLKERRGSSRDATHHAGFVSCPFPLARSSSVDRPDNNNNRVSRGTRDKNLRYKFLGACLGNIYKCRIERCSGNRRGLHAANVWSILSADVNALRKNRNVSRLIGIGTTITRAEFSRAGETARTARCDLIGIESRSISLSFSLSLAFLQSNGV